jgi:phage shock protein E
MKEKNRMGLGWIAAIAALALLLVVARSLLAGPRVDPAEARRLVAAGAALVDVRSPGEFASGHLPGAVNVPVQELAQRREEIPRDRPVVLYCASGVRSAQAARMLREAGWSEVHNLGGMGRWGD